MEVWEKRVFWFKTGEKIEIFVDKKAEIDEEIVKNGFLSFYNKIGMNWFSDKKIINRDKNYANFRTKRPEIIREVR